MAALSPEVEAIKASMATMKGQQSSSSATTLNNIILSPADVATLSGHFRPTVQEALKELTMHRRMQIMQYYYRELKRVVEEGAAAVAEKKAAGEKADADDETPSSTTSSPPFVIPATTPSETVTSAIATRILHFHGLEQTIKERMAIERKAATRSGIYASLMMGAFVILFALGMNWFVTTDNALKDFVFERFVGRKPIIKGRQQRAVETGL